MNDGRYWYRDQKTGRTFCVETISDRDQKITDRVFSNGGYTMTDHKWHSEAQGGSISADDSIITKENGFKNIITLPPGTSPDGYIEMMIKNESAHTS